MLLQKILGPAVHLYFVTKYINVEVQILSGGDENQEICFYLI